MAIDMNLLSTEERDQLDRLLNKANAPAHQPGVAPPTPADRPWGVAPPPNPPTITRITSPANWVEKQISTLSAVGEQNYRLGITQPKKDPIKAGIASQAKYAAQMAKPEVIARRAEGLGKTNMDEWASMSERIGAGRLVQGVTERRYKVERFVGRFQPLLASHVARLDAMPDVTDSDRERRMVENVRGLKALKGKA